MVNTSDYFNNAKNYETWAVQLWWEKNNDISNILTIARQQWSYAINKLSFEQLEQRLDRRERAIVLTSRALQQYFVQHLKYPKGTFFDILIICTLSKIDWDELAHIYLKQAIEEFS